MAVEQPEAERSRETASVTKQSGSACLAGSRTSLLAAVPLVVADCCGARFSAGVVAATSSASVGVNMSTCQPKELSSVNTVMVRVEQEGEMNELFESGEAYR